MYTISLPTFEGPLDVLLRLIERAELDITTISLAHVADQYLEHVRTLDIPDTRALADFVALASRLLLIKSHALLPRSATAQARKGAAAEKDARALVQQLREYQRYKKAARLFKRWQDEGRQTFPHTAPLRVVVQPHFPPLQHTVADLERAMRQRKRPAAAQAAPAATLTLVRRLSVGEVVTRVDSHLTARPSIPLDALLSQTSTRQEIVVTFWAVLELLKQRRILAVQAALFGPITIERGAKFEQTA
jgi:segregation and condensation protein A